MFRVTKQPRPSCSASVVAGSSIVRQLKASSEPVFPSAGIDSASDEERDWAQLLPDVVRKIGDGLLRDDVAEYIRLRTVCQPWRRATSDPKALEPRFFPRNWLLLLPPHDKLRGDGAAERFVNVRTGATLRIRLPTAEDEYTHHGNTEGLLILYHRDTDTVCLLNPLTMAFTDLPTMSGIDPAQSAPQLTEWDIKAAGVLVNVDERGHARSPLEPPTVVLSMTLGTRTFLLYARPSDFVWRLVDTSCADELEGKLPTIKGGLAVWGSFYISTRGSDVLKVVLEPQPHLIVVARQTGSSVCSGLSESSYIVSSGADSKDGMLLVRKKSGIRPDYRWWDVDVRNGRLIEMKTLNDRTIMLPSIALHSSAFPTIPQNQVCFRDYTGSFLLGNLF